MVSKGGKLGETNLESFVRFGRAAKKGEKRFAGVLEEARENVSYARDDNP